MAKHAKRPLGYMIPTKAAPSNPALSILAAADNMDFPVIYSPYHFLRWAMSLNGVDSSPCALSKGIIATDTTVAI